METIDKEILKPVFMEEDEEDIFAPTPLGDDDDADIEEKKKKELAEVDEEAFEDEGAEVAGVDIEPEEESF